MFEESEPFFNMSQETSSSAIFIGVNLGSERVNIVAVTAQGTILAESSAPFPRDNTSTSGDRHNTHETDPETWWEATRMALGHLVGQLQKIIPLSNLKAISISGDPGALVIVNRAGNPLLPAILAEDTRGTEYAKSLNFHGREHCAKMGFQFRAEDPLAKIVWLKENDLKHYEDALFVHQTDFIIGRLKGMPDVTEFSFAMRTGCDLIDECWPDWLDYDMYLSVRDRLPFLRHLGTRVGSISSKASAVTGLPTGMSIVMGTTTVMAAFLASGARKEGDLHTVFGKNLTISGISPTMMRSSQELIRNNKLPNRKWAFSVNSRTGTDWITAWFPSKTFAELETMIEGRLPNKYLAYPNVSKEETFPFVSNSAEGFVTPATEDQGVQFAACLQGTALFERYCYQRLGNLAGEQGAPGDVYTGGEWSTSDLWMQCRADVTGRINRRMRGHSDAALGTAIIAALGGEFGSLEDVANAMLAVDATFFPNPEKHAQYSELYQDFCDTMEEQGYGGAVLLTGVRYTRGGAK